MQRIRFRPSTPFLTSEIIASGNPAAKASVDIALHDLVGKLMKQPWYNIWGYDPSKAPVTTFMIGIDTPEVVTQKTREAAEFKVLKISSAATPTGPWSRPSARSPTSP